MLIKDLFCNELVEDFKVKDPTTWHKDRADQLRALKVANVEIEGKPENRPVIVKSVRPKKLVWNEEGNIWVFNCKIKVEVLD